MARTKTKKQPAAKAKKAKPVKKTVKKVAKPVKKIAKKVIKKPVQKISALLKTAKPVLKIVAKTAPKKSAALDVGSAVPDFTMPATMAGKVSLAALKGKPFVLYFYPKDDTSGCTAQACEFRNTLSVFNNLGAEVIGVSKDTMESHEKFSRKYNLTFPLASDETSGICEKFGTWVQKSMYGRSYMGIERSTFVIDSKGVIRAVWRKVSVPGHIDEVKKAVEAL
jgi:peroxiredoxin Q/BCP